jgi:hypothetical protein
MQTVQFPEKDAPTYFVLVVLLEHPCNRFCLALSFQYVNLSKKQQVKQDNDDLNSISE